MKANLLSILKSVTHCRLSRTGVRGIVQNAISPTDPEATAITRALMALREKVWAGANDQYLFLDYCRQNASVSTAQIFQDLFVLFQTKEKRSGFFVEFGAGNGRNWSNTYLLEKKFGWSGIVAEPARIWHDALRDERRCAIDLRCVWNKSGDYIEFNEVEQPEYSTIAQYSSADMHAQHRKAGRHYCVESVTLIDLLAQHDAPKLIDYLSIDTEGSELEILKAFDFEKYDVHLITVEHNHRADRAGIHDLLQSSGFVQKFEGVSLVDDWYVKCVAESP